MVHLLEVATLNIEEDMDLLPSIKFLAHNTARSLLQLEGRVLVWVDGSVQFIDAKHWSSKFMEYKNLSTISCLQEYEP